MSATIKSRMDSIKQAKWGNFFKFLQLYKKAPKNTPFIISPARRVKSNKAA